MRTAFSRIRNLKDGQVMKYRLGKADPVGVEWEDWTEGALHVQKRSKELPKEQRGKTDSWQKGAVTLLKPKSATTAEFSEDDYTELYDLFLVEEHVLQIKWPKTPVPWHFSEVHTPRNLYKTRDEVAYVKVSISFDSKSRERLGGETFWIKVAKIAKNGDIDGTVCNELISYPFHGFDYHDPIKVKAKHIIDWMTHDNDNA